MKAAVCLLVVILVYLAGFGHAGVIKGKVSHPYVLTQVQEVKQVEEEQQGDGDDLIKDPDWVPTAEDYHYEDEDEDEDEWWSSDDDPDWQPTEEDEDEDEDELWSSDDDPDWQPTEEDEDELWSSDDDPDWQPTEEDENEDEDEDEWWSSDDDPDWQPTDWQPTEEDEDEDEDKLWSSDDDPDWQPTEEDEDEWWSSVDDPDWQPTEEDEDEDQIKNLIRYKRYHYGTKGADVSELSHGVEPLGGGGGHHVDLSTGVEPERDDDDDFSLGDWLEHQWGRVSDTAESVGDKISDVASHVAGTAHDVASHTIDKIQDAAESVGEHVVTAYHYARESVPRLQTYIASAFSNFGLLIQQGHHYCFQRLTHIYDQVRGSEVLDKLQQKLQEGDAEVAEFFQLIGQKLETWGQQQVPKNVDDGLIIHHNQQEQERHNHQQEGGHTEQIVPDLFQDQEVRIHLSKLVEEGVLAQDDLLVFSQQEQGQQQEQHESAVKSRG